MWHINNLKQHYEALGAEFWPKYTTIFFELYRLQLMPVSWFENELHFIRDRWDEIHNRHHGYVLTAILHLNLRSENALYLLKMGLPEQICFEIDKKNNI